jgi:multicomponent Na+:H+ antiporter subunit D
VALLRQVWHHGVLSTQVGDWPAPFGITIVADTLAAVMTTLAGIIGLATAIYSLVEVDSDREAYGYYPLLHLLLMGVCGAFLTGDVFNLYVWFEVMLISSFILLALGGERAQIEGAIKYVTINLVASAILLSAIGILYGMTGTLNMADLARKIAHVEHPALVNIAAMLFLVPFGIKAATFPLFFWLPASYHTPPVAVSAIFSGLLTKVGVYALVRFFTLLFKTDHDFTQPLILLMAALTMLTGVLGAVAQNDFRRILSFHIISQIGYMVMGLGLFTRAGVAGAVFYIVHHVIVKTNLFLISGVSRRITDTELLSRSGGLYSAFPGVSLLFVIAAFSLAGVPPLSGFFAKLMLIQAGLEQGWYTIVAVAILVSLLTLYSMTKIWNEAFWKPLPKSQATQQPPPMRLAERAALVGPAVALAALTLLFALFAGPLTKLSLRAADELLDSSAYVRAVLGEPEGNMKGVSP